MRFLFRVLGALIAVALILFVATGIVRFVQQAWFGNIFRSSKIAVLEVTGVLWTSNQFVKQIESVLEDGSYKAIVVRINSPGGLVAPSQEIFEAIKKADAKIPVIISMGALAASGGYYAALGGRKIFANSGTLTGSIGVIMEFVNTEKLYHWAKVDRFSLKAGKFKDAGTPLRQMTPEERELMIRMLTDIHAQFKQSVHERRKISEKDLENVTDGRVLTGSQALQARLVDSLGGIQEALAAARQTANLSEKAPVEYVVEKPSLLRRLLFGEEDSSSESLLSFALNTLKASDLVSPSPGWRVLLLAPLS